MEGTTQESHLHGLSVLITGASRGIGAATARLFSKSGAKLGIAGRKGAALSEVAEETGARVFFCDVSDYSQVNEAVDGMCAAFGRVDVLINNAAILEPIGPVYQLNPDQWKRQIEVNLNGIFFGLRAALPVMLSQGSGTIINIGSGRAHVPGENRAGYCASKAGAYMLTKVAQLECGDTVRIMSLSPGVVATEMQSKVKASGLSSGVGENAVGQVSPEFVAEALSWMCSSSADQFRGEEISLRDPVVRALLSDRP
ncbi:MAG: SDR family oxidoreductase [Pararhodobacter sp.]|nr:SDR family oxidoreductase [Pararhodobacter sp.]